MSLTLDHFLQAGRDFESAQYRILDGLQAVRRAFAKNTIYPHLGEIVELRKTLRAILGGAQDVASGAPRALKAVDLDSGELVFERLGLERGQFGLVEDLIEWALPHIEAAIEEGSAIFEFVEEHLYMEVVGIVPSYVEEGYLLLPERASGDLHVLRYTLSIFTHAEERYRSLKTTYVQRLGPAGVLYEPRRVKLDLAQAFPDLPNPATYYVDSELGFPFEATLLPVAKRKLMRHLMQADT